MAIPTAAITGHIRTPDGLPMTGGKLTARLSHPGSALDGSESVRVSSEATVDISSAGAVSLALVPNDSITPSGTTYVVTVVGSLPSGRRVQWSERWQITGTVALDLGAVPRLDVVPGIAVSTESAVQASVLASATASADAASASQIAASASEVSAATSATTASLAASNASAAADAAAIAGKVYANTTAGLAATSSGEYFSVPSGTTTESLILYLNSTGTAVEQKRYPSQLLADQVTWAGGQVAADEYPNLIADYAWTASAWTSVRSVVNGRAAITITSTSKVVRIPRSVISGGVVSASVRIESQAASSGTPRILLQQRTAALAEVGGTRQTYSIGTAAVTSPINVQFSNVTLDATTVWVDLYMEASTGALVLSQPMMCGGTIAQFRVPPRPTVVNRFTDPLFRGVDMISGGKGTRITEGYEPVLDITGGIQERNHWIPVSGAMQPGATMYISGDVWSTLSSSASLSMYFLDAAGADLGGSVTANNGATTSAWVSVALSAVMPASCAYVRVRMVKSGASGESKWRRIYLTTEYVAGQARLIDLPAAPPPQVWVSPTGSDSASGDAATPLASLGRAISVLQGRGRIVMQDGDYTGTNVTTSLDSVTDIEIVADGSSRPRIIGGTKLTSITKTGGFTKVYQCAWPTSAPAVDFLWEHEVPEAGTLIPASERHPLQRGRIYRLPSTRIRQVASIAAIDAASGPSWYWAANVLYFSVASGGAPVADVYVPSTGVFCTRSSAKTDMPRISITGVEVWYSIWQLTGTDYTLRDCYGLGGYGTCMASNGARGTEIRCEWAGGSVDGSGAHGVTTTPYAFFPVESSRLVVDCWTHDNSDDGDSIHERCAATYIGGLSEYNGGCGFAPAYGAHVEFYGTWTRHNDLLSGTKGGGFAAIGAVDVGEGGVGTQIYAVDCIAENESTGFNAGASDSTVIAVNCRTVNCTTAYGAISGGVMRLRDCKDSGSGTLKGGAGTFDVVNGTTVT